MASENSSPGRIPPLPHSHLLPSHSLPAFPKNILPQPHIYDERLPQVRHPSLAASVAHALENRSLVRRIADLHSPYSQHAFTPPPNITGGIGKHAMARSSAEYAIKERNKVLQKAMNEIKTSKSTYSQKTSKSLHRSISAQQLRAQQEKRTKAFSPPPALDEYDQYWEEKEMSHMSPSPTNLHVLNKSTLPRTNSAPSLTLKQKSKVHLLPPMSKPSQTLEQTEGMYLHVKISEQNVLLHALEEKEDGHILLLEACFNDSTYMSSIAIFFQDLQAFYINYPQLFEDGQRELLLYVLVPRLYFVIDNKILKKEVSVLKQIPRKMRLFVNFDASQIPSPNDPTLLQRIEQYHKEKAEHSESEKQAEIDVQGLLDRILNGSKKKKKKKKVKIEEEKVDVSSSSDSLYPPDFSNKSRRHSLAAASAALPVANKAELAKRKEVINRKKEMVKQFTKVKSKKVSGDGNKKSKHSDSDDDEPYVPKKKAEPIVTVTTPPPDNSTVSPIRIPPINRTTSLAKLGPSDPPPVHHSFVTAYEATAIPAVKSPPKSVKSETPAVVSSANVAVEVTKPARKDSVKETTKENELVKPSRASVVASTKVVGEPKPSHTDTVSTVAPITTTATTDVPSATTAETNNSTSAPTAVATSSADSNSSVSSATSSTIRSTTDPTINPPPESIVAPTKPVPSWLGAAATSTPIVTQAEPEQSKSKPTPSWLGGGGEDTSAPAPVVSEPSKPVPSWLSGSNTNTATPVESKPVAASWLTPATQQPVTSTPVATPAPSWLTPTPTTNTTTTTTSVTPSSSIIETSEPAAVTPVPEPVVVAPAKAAPSWLTGASSIASATTATKEVPSVNNATATPSTSEAAAPAGRGRNRGPVKNKFADDDEPTFTGGAKKPSKPSWLDM